MGNGIGTGFDRLDAFLAVQGPCPPPDAVLRLQEAVGIDDDEREVIRQRVAALGHPEHAGAVLLGILVGLFAAAEGGETRLAAPSRE
jgi:hypothetical protein